MISQEKQRVSQVTFSNLVFGDEFASNEIIWIHNDLFYVLEIKFQSKKVKIRLYNEFLSEIQCNLSSIYMALVLSFNLQSESLVIHLSHKIHDITKSFASLNL